MRYNYQLDTPLGPETFQESIQPANDYNSLFAVAIEDWSKEFGDAITPEDLAAYTLASSGEAQYATEAERSAAVALQFSGPAPQALKTAFDTATNAQGNKGLYGFQLGTFHDKLDDVDVSITPHGLAQVSVEADICEAIMAEFIEDANVLLQDYKPESLFESAYSFFCEPKYNQYSMALLGGYPAAHLLSLTHDKDQSKLPVTAESDARLVTFIKAEVNHMYERATKSIQVNRENLAIARSILQRYKLQDSKNSGPVQELPNQIGYPIEDIVNNIHDEAVRELNLPVIASASLTGNDNYDKVKSAYYSALHKPDIALADYPVGTVAIRETTVDNDPLAQSGLVQWLLCKDMDVAADYIKRVGATFLKDGPGEDDGICYVRHIFVKGQEN